MSAKPGEAFDQSGKEIQEFDLLKVFHFTAALRRKKHYMYKFVTVRDGYLFALHLNGTDGGYWLRKGVIDGTEIIQSPKTLHAWCKSMEQSNPEIPHD